MKCREVTKLTIHDVLRLFTEYMYSSILNISENKENSNYSYRENTIRHRLSIMNIYQNRY